MPAPDAPLTDDQLRVVALVVRGLTDRQIASRLGISESSVQRRIRESSAAMSVASRVELAVAAVSSGLVEVPESSASTEGDGS